MCDEAVNGAVSATTATRTATTTGREMRTDSGPDAGAATILTAAETGLVDAHSAMTRDHR